jgi:Holliday junction DNA helicase RuvA
MIAHLRGRLLSKHPNQVIVEAAGVGYDVTITIPTFSDLPSAGTEVRLRIHTHVREDALQLYGFATEEEEAVFHELIGVKNVGPRAAQNILSGIEARELARAIADGDVARLTEVSGVGKKTAERLVVELKDRLVTLARAAAPAAGKAGRGAGPLDQLEQALVGLGYKPAQAQAAAETLRQRGGEATLDELLRQALKLLRG